MYFPLFFGLLAVVAADCPPGLTLLLSTNQRPVTCSPQDLCSCDNETPGSICQYSRGQNSYFCCTGEAPQCGAKSPLISSTGQTVMCRSSNDCVNGYSCVKGICCASGPNPVCSSRQCLDGQELIDGRCIDTVPIGSYCRQTKMCQGGSECVRSRCQCPPGTSNFNGQCTPFGKKCERGTVLVNGQCEPLAPPGTRCLAEEQCIDNSLCSSNTCQCTMGLKLINGYCIRRRGERCPRTQTWINNQCVSYSTVGGKCIGNGQCVGGSICNSRGICSCDDGFFEMDLYCIADNSSSPCSSTQVLVNGQCLEKVPLGSRCSYTPQCLGNSRCTNGFCQCLRGSSETKATCSSPECGRNQVFVNRKCVPMVSVGDRCLFTEQCTGNSQCLNGFCECANGAASFDGICDITSSFCKSYQVEVNNECLNKVSIGQHCLDVAQCVENAICSGNCQCSYSTTYNGTACVRGIKHCPAGTVSVASRCLPLVPIGDPCRTTLECMGYGICSSSRCRCRNGWTSVYGVCQPSDESSRCNSNEVLINSQCYPFVQIGQRCAFNQQCIGGSSCEFDVCSCPPNTFDDGNGLCRSDGGPSGEQLCPLESDEAVYDTDYTEPINCRVKNCPAGSYCELNQRLGQYFCCRPREDSGKSAEKCSNPSQSVIYKDGAPINCLYSRCPANSHCEHSSTAQQYVCCG